MFESPEIQDHNSQISLFYILQFKSSCYFDFLLPQFINFLYFLKKRLQKLVFNGILVISGTLDQLLGTLNIRKTPMKVVHLELLAKRFADFLFISFSIVVQKCYLVQNFEKMHFAPFSAAYYFFYRFFKHLTVYFSIQPTNSTEHLQKLRASN